jgi:putative flippase GtrA
MALKRLHEATAYVGVAGLSALSDWAMFAAISRIYPEVDVVFAQAPARLMGGLVAFLLHRQWSFGNQEGLGIGTEARRFLMLYVFSFCVSIGTVFVLVDLLGFNRFASKAVADILCFIVNFVVMKFYVFADTPTITQAAGDLRQARRSDT